MPKLPKHISFLLSFYLLGIIFFFIFRLILFFTEINQLENIPNSFWVMLQAFWMGFRFDTTISGYFLVLPLLVLSVAAGFRADNKLIYKIISVFLITIYSLAFFICAADIPYFNHYFSHLTSAVFNFLDNPSFVFKMIIDEPSFYIYIVLFLFVCGVFAHLTISLSFGEGQGEASKLSHKIYFSVIAGALLFLGIRGTISKKPIRLRTAFFCDYAFPNQLGLNPVYTLVRSYLDENKSDNKKIDFMDDKLAVSYVQQFLNIPESTNNSPVARKITSNEKPINANIILVMMESMSAAKMRRYGCSENLTPNLDSIANHSLCFENIFSAGIHTYNGIFSTLFSLPALMNQHTMKNAFNVQKFSGMPETLKNQGYQTNYFTTHDREFDNLGVFLPLNDFDNFYCWDDYEKSERLGLWGVPDDYLFHFTIPKMNELHKNNQPFFVAMNTISDHEPYLFPKNTPFVPHSKDAQKKLIEYADWSIGRFIKSASQQDWFKNTIFVFVADHGEMFGNNFYDMPLSFHHIPLIIYAPYLFPEPKSFPQLGLQIDIYPTLMGLLNRSYVNNSMGIDLLREQRPFAYFSADDKLGCLNNDYFFVQRNSGVETLYKYKNGDTKNYLEQNKSLVDSMKTYTYSMLQATQWMISNKKVKE